MFGIGMLTVLGWPFAAKRFINWSNGVHDKSSSKARR
jgi:hypothetical protein